MPRGGGAFGTTYSVLLRRNTILNWTDVPANLVFRDAPGNNRRPLSAVIAHERVHALMDRRYGAMACLRMPDWKKEGYCEAIAGSPSFDMDEGKRLMLMRQGKNDSSGPFRYFQYRLMVKYLLDVERLDIDEIIARQFSPDDLSRSAAIHR